MTEPNPNRPIEDLLKFDALAEAEKVTGKPYQGDEGTTGLGMFLLHSKSRALKERLVDMKDTYFGMSWEYFRSTLLDGFLGFEEVWTNKFRGIDFDNKPYGYEDTESMFLSKERGIIVFAESYSGGSSVNGGHCFMQYRAVSEVMKVWSTISSGCFVDKERNILRNELDIREGLLYYLTKIDLMPEKEWVTPWVGPEYDRRPWILNYDETHEPERLTGNRFDTDAFSRMKKEKWAKMPAVVQEIIGKGE